MSRIDTFICEICYDDILLLNRDIHVKVCAERQANALKQIVEENKDPGFDALTPTQSKAIRCAHVKAKAHEKNTKYNVLIRLTHLGYGQNEFDIIRAYLAKVKVTVNIRTITISTFLIGDKHLKNLFEIGRGNSGRTDWEDNLFGKNYHHAMDIEKVKYGALNIFNEEKGIGSCRGYGESFIVLKDRVKKRITFVNGDSCQKQLHICTFDNYMQLLLHVTDNFIQDILKVARGEEKLPGYAHPYVEAQIHGTLSIDDDIDYIVIPDAEAKLNATGLRAFSEAHPKVQIRLMSAHKS